MVTDYKKSGEVFFAAERDFFHMFLFLFLCRFWIIPYNDHTALWCAYQKESRQGDNKVGQPLVCGPCTVCVKVIALDLTKTEHQILKDKQGGFL